jgi:hypothetical protein
MAFEVELTQVTTKSKKLPYTWTLDYVIDIQALAIVYHHTDSGGWAKVIGGDYREKIRLMQDIEKWIEQTKIKTEFERGRYCFENSRDLTMLLMKWSSYVS